MNKDLHDIDDAFRQAYQTYEDAPSANAWERINAALDKEDADKYRRRFIGWKRIAVLLAFLLSGLLIHETGILNNRNSNAGLADKNGTIDSAFSAHKQKDIPGKRNNAATQEKAGRNENNAAGNTLDIPPETVVSNDRDPLYRLSGEAQRKAQNNTQPGDTDPGEKRKKPTLWYKTEQETTWQKERKTNSDFSLYHTVSQRQESYAGNNIGEINTKKDQNQAPGLLQYVPGLLPVKKTEEVNTALRLNRLATLNPPGMSKVNKLISLLQSKNTQSSASFKPYWSVTAFASNDWSQYHLDNDDEDNAGVSQDEMEKISRREKHEASFSAGIVATRQFRKNIGVRTGILYSNIAIAISPQEMYAAKEPDGAITYKYIASSGYSYVKPGFGVAPAIGDSIQSTEAQHNLYTISVPVMALYTWRKNKFSISPAVGLSASFITGAKIETEVKDALNRETVIMDKLNGMRNFYMGLLTDIHVQYHVTSKWSLGLAPGFKYALTPITKKNVVKTFPYSFNIGGGITYNF